MSIAPLVDMQIDALLTMQMTQKKHRPPLTKVEQEEKQRIREVYLQAKKQWLEKGEKLTDQKLGEVVADAIGRESSFTQGAVWQFTSLNSGTRPPDEFIIGVSIALNVPLDYLSARVAADRRRLSVNEPNTAYGTNLDNPQAIINQLLPAASPRTYASLEKLQQAYEKGDLTQDDLDLLDAIARRLTSDKKR